MEGEIVICKEEQILESDHFPPYGSTDPSLPASPDTGCLPHAAPVSCHFYYPSADEDSGVEALEEEEGADPLAVYQEPLTILQPELITVNNKLLELENLPDTSAENFSVIDPLKIVESPRTRIKVEIDVDENQTEFKPSFKQLEEYSRKRNLSSSGLSDSFPVPSKKMYHGVWMDSNIDLMEFQVNIGPKLPLPRCFQKNRRTEAVKLQRNSGKCDSPCAKEDELRPNQGVSNNIVLKIYTCPACDHKCTDLQSHEAHVAGCGPSPPSYSPTSQQQTRALRKGFYFCEVCSFKFINEQNLIAHEDKHSKEKGFYCYLCEVRIPTVDSLRFHIADQHKGSMKVFPCNICEYTTVNPHHLKDHMVVHNTDKHLQCYVCKTNSETEHESQEHKLAHQTLGKNKKLFKTRNHILVETVNQRHGLPHQTTGEKRKGSKTQNHVKVKTEDKGQVYSHNHQTMGENRKLLRTQNHVQVQEGVINKIKSHRPNKLAQLKSEFNSEIVCINNVYHCNGCTFKFASLNNLTKHKKQHLKEAIAYTCPHCAHETLSLVNLLSHFKTDQCGRVVDGVTYNCNICKKPFQHWKYLRSHSVTHVYDNLYCFRCRVNHEDSASLTQHMLTEHGQETRIFSCTKCAFKTYQPDTFRHHMKKHMNNEILLGVESIGITDRVEQKNNNSTVVASKEKTKDKITTKDSLINQLNAELNSSYNSLQQKNKLNAKTAVTKSNTMSFNCNKCGFKFYDLSLFVKHHRIHNRETEKFRCSTCPYTSSRLGFYIHHIKTHTGIAFFNCKFCGYETKERSDFDEHVSKHYIKHCPKCAYKTKKMEDYKKHVAMHLQSSKHKFICSFCPYTARTQRLLSVHISKFHKKEHFLKKSGKNAQLKPAIKSQLKPHACTFCPFRTSRKHDLNRHLSKHCKGALNLNVTHNKVGNSLLKNKIKTAVDKKPPLNRTSSTAYLYGCSQCEFVSYHRKSVALHLKSIHQTSGGIRNNMIVKMHAPPPENKQIKKDKHKEQKRVVDATKVHARLPENKQIKKDKHKEQKRVVVTTKVQGVELVRCAKCNINKLSFYAQVRHKQIGHSQFWSKPIACTWSQCGARFTTKSSLQRHNMKQHRGEQLSAKSGTRKEHIETSCRSDTPKHKPVMSQQNDYYDKHRTTDMGEAEEVMPDVDVEMEPDSDDDNYSCGECDFVALDVTELIKHMFIHSGIPDD